MARFPRLHIEERVLIVVRRLVRFPGASRHSHSSSKHRYSHSHTTHRHPSSHSCTRDRPHGLMGNSTIMQRYSYYNQVKRYSAISTYSKQHLHKQNSTDCRYLRKILFFSTGLRRCCHILVLSLRSRFGALRLPLTPPRLSLYTTPRSPPVRACRGRPGASRHTQPHTRHRNTQPHTRHRHTRSHCRTRDRPHGLMPS